MLSKEQLDQIKNQLIQQITSSMPPEQQGAMVQEIQNMNAEQLIEFLKQNGLIKDEADLTSKPEGQQCIFCALATGQVPSTKLAENDKAIAILELNPVSEGHTIIIPKEHIATQKEIPPEAFLLAEEVTNALKSSLQPREVLTQTSNLFGHEIINLIPVYTNENLQSPKQQKTPEQLAEIKKKIGEIKKIQKTPKEKVPTCIPCSILKQEIHSYKIDENKSAIAVIDISPVSKGQVIIIPKEHISEVEKVPTQTYTLAKKIAKKIKTKLKPKEVLISNSNIQGHQIINLIPIYKDETPTDRRIELSKEELEKIQKKLEKKATKKRKPKSKSTSNIKQKEWLPQRIP